MVVVAPVLIAWGVFLLALCLWALSQAGQTAIRAFFETILRVIPSPPVIGHLIGKGVDWLIRHTVKPISDAALAVEAPIAGFFSHAASVVERYAFSTYYTAVHTYDALWKLRHAIIPALIRAAVWPVSLSAHEAHRLAVALWHALYGARAIPRRLTRQAIAEATRAERIAARAWAKAQAGAIAAPIPWVEHEIGAARALAERALARVREMRKLLAGATIGALAIVALGRIGAGWVKCSNWQKIGRAGCRIPTRLLDDLLGLAVDFLVVTNVCTVLPYLTRVASEVGTPLIEGLTAAGAGLCRGASAPAALHVQLDPASLPTSTGLAPLV